MKVAITGTPGTGKTRVAKKLGSALGFPVIDLNSLLVKEYALGRDIDRDTTVVDIYRASRTIKLPGDCVVDGHLSHFLGADVVVVLRCKPGELRRRLRNKGWAEEKVRENAEAEALNIISLEARENNKRVFDIDTTEKSVNEVVEEIIKAIKENRPDEGLDFLEFL